MVTQPHHARRVSADHYLTDDLRVGASYTTAFQDNLYRGQAEYQITIGDYSRS
jgi:hypothetical protein